MSGENGIDLSVVVRIVGGPAFAQRCLNRLVPQSQGRPIEVIVPHDSTVSGMDQLKRRFPQVIFVDMGFVQTDEPPSTYYGAHELYDRRTAKGLSVAQGELLALLEDTAVPDPDWCDQILKAHRLPYGVIGGAVEHKGHGTLNWAVYFLDFGRYQLPLHEGPTDYLTDVNVSYKRAVLQSVKELWTERYNEVTVHWALAKQGVTLWQRPQIVVRQDRGKLSFSELIVERFCWGRLFGCVRMRETASVSRPFYIIFGPGIPLVLLGRMACKVFSGRRNRGRFLRSFPQTVAMTLSWCLGELVGYAAGREDSC